MDLEQRANLIQILCETLVNNISKAQRSVIMEEDVNQAMSNDKLFESFQDWNDISKDTKEQWIDRVVVYSTIAQDSFDDAFLQGLIKTHNLAIDGNELDKSLARLRIGYIIKKIGNKYSYRVPIFREWIMSGDIKARLEQEIKNRLVG